MKKRILGILLILCMTVVFMPTAAGAKTTELTLDEAIGKSVTVNVGIDDNVDSAGLCTLAEAEVNHVLEENGYTGYEATISYTTALTTESGDDYAATYSKAGFKLEVKKGEDLQKTVYPFEIKVQRGSDFNAVLGQPDGFADADLNSFKKLEITGSTAWEIIDGKLVHSDVNNSSTSFFVLDAPKGDKHFSMEAEYTEYRLTGTSEISLLLGNSKEKNALQLAFTIPSPSKEAEPYYCVQVIERPYTSATDWGYTRPNLFLSENLGEAPYNLPLNDTNKKLKIDVYMQGSVVTYQVNGITITQFDLAAYDDAFKDNATEGIPKDTNSLLQSADTFGYGCVRCMDLTIKNVSLESYQTKFGDEESRTQSKNVIKNGETMDAAFAGIFYGFGVDSIETEEGTLLNEGTDYSVEENVVKLKKEYLNQLTEDTKLKVNFAAGQPGYISLTLTEAGVMMPSAIFNARSMTLSNVDVGMFYQLSEEGEWIAITAESVSLADNSVDSNYGIRVKNIVDGQESEIQTITVSKHEQPSVADTNVDAIMITDYKTLFGYEYEVSSDNGSTWNTVSVDSSGKTGYLDAGTYQIRVKGVSTMLKSDSVEVVVSHVHGSIEHKEAKAATCTEAGNNGYWTCGICHKVYTDEACENETTVEKETLAALVHKLNKTDEVPATTTQYGVKAYWTCSECDKYFSDAEGKTEIPDLDAWKQNEGRINKKSSGSSGGSSYTPVQKPVIEKNDNVKTELSSDGTKLTIKAEEGYEITDVLVNGVSKGAAGELTGLKTGDKVEIKTAKKADSIQPTDPSTDKNAKLVKGINATSIILKSKLTENRKVLLTWTKSKGYKVDSYEVYRSVKKNSGYGKTAFFKTKDGNWSKYLNTKGLKAGKTYYYKVRGVRTLDGQKYYTQWSNKAWRTI